jgi:hypothetical protein
VRASRIRGLAVMLAIYRLFSSSASATSESGGIVTRTGTVDVPVSCPGTRISYCAVLVTLRAKEPGVGAGSHGRWVAAGSTRVRRLGGERRKIAVGLDQAGARLLKELHRLHVRYMVTVRPEALTGTIMVHKYFEGGGVSHPCQGTECPAGEASVYVVRVGSGEKTGTNGKVVSWIETSKDRIAVAPGEYEVGWSGIPSNLMRKGQRLGVGVPDGAGEIITVHPGQVVEIMRSIERE